MTAAVSVVPRPAPVVHCSCGREHALEAWLALPYVGIQLDLRGGRFELRNCPCGSTRARRLPMPARSPLA